MLDEWALLVEQYSIKRNTAFLLVSTDMIAPATCGLFRARVLLPANPIYRDQFTTQVRFDTRGTAQPQSFLMILNRDTVRAVRIR